MTTLRPGKTPRQPASHPAPPQLRIDTAPGRAVGAGLRRAGLSAEPQSTFAQLAPALVKMAARGETVELRIDTQPAGQSSD